MRFAPVPGGLAGPSPLPHRPHLEYFTVAYNILEAAASLAFGAMASSIALIGFGLDSVVKSLSGLPHLAAPEA